VACTGYGDEVKEFATLEANTEACVQELSSIQWSRDAEAWRPQARALGMREIGRHGQRISYKTDSAPILIVDEFFGSENELLFVECTLEASGITRGLSVSEYEDMVDEYFERFEKSVASVASILGDPKFNDGRGAEGFPKDQDSDWLALWHIRGARLMIQQKHEDRELPFRICAVVVPD
jgi:hypothetical protein